MTETILSIVTVLLGGCNIFQFFFFRQEKKKAIAAANEAMTNSARSEFDFQKDQSDYILEKLTTLQRQYMDMQEEVRSQAVKHTEEILSKCNLIADLKSQVVYLKRFRCYKSDCSMRISTNIKDNDHKEDISNENEQSGDSQIEGV